MRALLFCLVALPFAASASPGAAPGLHQPKIQSAVDAVRADELRATITRLVGFGTRHTLSDTVSNTRGIGAARRWVQARFGQISKDCGGCLEVVMPAQEFTGKRIPNPTTVMDVVAIQ